MERSLPIAVVALVAVLSMAFDAWAGGWYLLVPRTSLRFDDAGTALWSNEDEPLSNWYKKGAFDTATECVTRQQRLVDEEWRTYEVAMQHLEKAPDRRLAQLMLAATLASECVASDDRRLLR